MFWGSPYPNSITGGGKVAWWQIGKWQVSVKWQRGNVATWQRGMVAKWQVASVSQVSVKCQVSSVKCQVSSVSQVASGTWQRGNVATLPRGKVASGKWQAEEQTTKCIYKMSSQAT